MSVSLRSRITPAPGHPSVAERAAAGKAARAAMPRSRHAELVLAPGRDPVGLIEREGEGRLADLLPIRHARMNQSALAFYRGTASLMAGDLFASPSAGLNVQLCGDAHLSNFGVFGSPDRALVFDLNDFDETLPGSFDWDVKRLAASFALTGRALGIALATRREIVLEAVGWYRRAIRDFADLGNLGVWYSRLDAAQIDRMVSAIRGTRSGRAFEQAATKARSRDHTRAVGRLTEVVAGKLRFVSRPPLIVPIDEFIPADRDRDQVEEQLNELLRRYRRSLQQDRRKLLDQYRYVDLAHKVVGVGSVGTRCWMALFVGKDDADPLVLQVKEASPSVLEAFAGKSRYPNAGQRVVEGQRLMQAASDIFLGWIRNQAGLDGNVRDFYFRQLWDWKGSIDVETVDAEGLRAYARMCGWTLARAHARSGDRVALASYLGKTDVFDKAVATFAESYADVAGADYAAFGQAVESGRLPVGQA